VERMTKKGLREFDCRAAVVSLAVRDAEGAPELDLVLRHTVPAVRPDDVLTGLAHVAGEPGPVGAEPAPEPTPGSALMTRWAQGPLDETTGSVGDPLASSA